MLPTRTTVLLLTRRPVALAGRTRPRRSCKASCRLAGAGRRPRQSLARPRLRRLRHAPVPRRRRLRPMATRRGRLAVRRERPARLSLGVDNEIVLVAREPVPAATAADRPRSTVPRASGPSRCVLDAVVPAHGWARLPYRLLPTRARQLLLRRRVGALPRAARLGVRRSPAAGRRGGAGLSQSAGSAPL